MPVRDCQDADLDAICALVNHEIRTGSAHFGTEPVAPDALRAHWRRERDRYPWLVAHDGDAFAGYAKAGPWKARGAYRWTAEIGVYVLPASQGRGVGRGLCDALLARLGATGFRTVIAGIALPNPPSVRLHEALGFSHAGTLPRVGHKHGRWIDVGYWTLHLPGDEPG